MWALWPAAALGEGEAPRCHRGLREEAAGGREAAFLRENKGRPGGGASRPARPSPVRSLATLALWEEPAALLFARSGAEVPAAMLWPRSSAASHTRPVGRGERTGGGQSRPGSR